MENKLFLFPLQNSVLFKKVTLPYHIFEDRYRKMIRDACDMQIPVGIVSYHSSNDYSGEVCVAGIPHILNSYPDGRMDIYITGQVKCRIGEPEKEEPYKVYTYKAIDEKLDVDDRFEIELESLKTFLQRWALHFLPDPIQRENFVSTLDEPEILVNYCSVFLVDDPRIKKEVMMADTMRDKIQILLHVMGPKEVSLGPFMPALKF